jgi:hypothetical protein
MAAARWVVPLLALAALTLTAIPAAVWRHPSVDSVQTGFDRNLMYASSGAESGQSTATLAGPVSSINLLGTPMTEFAASLDVAVRVADADSVPLRIGVWSPWTRAGFFLQFNAAQNSVETQVLVGGRLGPTLRGGQLTRGRLLGMYSAGDSYHIRFEVDRKSAISVSAFGNGLDAKDAVTRTDVPDLFTGARVALTASAAAPAGATAATLANYSLTLPHQRYWADRVDDNLVRVLHVALLVVAVLLVGVNVSMSLWRRSWVRPGQHIRQVLTAVAVRKKLIAALGAAVVAYLVGNALLFPLGGHPFDFGNEKVYAYVARTFGPAQLYYLPNVVSLARIWSGVPFVEAAFPYEPVTGYLYVAIGWMGSLLLAGGGAFGLDDVRLDYLIKTVNVIFGLLDASLIYLILRELRTGVRWSLIASGMFLFNPAVWFSMSIWGQTHVISLFFVLAAVLLAERNRPTLAWTALAAATLTRPQMVVFALLLGIVFLRKFSWRQNLFAISWTVIVVFLILAPFTLATSPSLPVDIMLNNFNIQEGGGNEVALTTVSQDAYSIWPFITYLAHGTSGVARTFTPSSDVLVGSLTYQRISQVLTLVALLSVGAVLLLRKRSSLASGGYLPLVALGMTSFLMLLTGIVATHFVLALPFLLLCRRWMGRAAYFYVAAIWTVTTFVPMFGDMGVVLSKQDYPLLAPATNAITKSFVDLYSWDRFITVAVVANTCAVIWLAYLTVGSGQIKFAPCHRRPLSE